MIRRLRARFRARRLRRLTTRFQQVTSGGHVTADDLRRYARGGVVTVEINPDIDRFVEAMRLATEEDPR